MFFKGVFHIPHLCEGMRIPTEVLHEVSIFMKDGPNNHLQVGGMISENIKGIFGRVIHTIGGGIFIPQGKNLKLKGPTLGLLPNICLTPLNHLSHNSTKFGGGHLIGLGL